MFMAFFGTVWADVGIGGLRELSSIWLLILAVFIGAVLFFGGLSLMRGSKNFSHTHGRSSRKVDQWFTIIFVTEFALITTAGFVCNAVGHFDLFFPIMAIIVGVHFFPLAFLF